MEPLTNEKARKKSDYWVSMMSKTGIRFDYSLAGLQILDLFVEATATQCKFDKDGQPSSAMDIERVWTLGIYLGETLREAYGGDWIQPSSPGLYSVKTAAVLLAGKIEVYPIEKIRKRMIHGKEENLVLYLSKLAAALNKIDPDIKMNPSIQGKPASEKVDSSISRYPFE